MIAVNDLMEIALVVLMVSHMNLHMVKDALVVIMEREDAALLKNPVMKVRETVMDQEMVDNMMVMRDANMV